MIASRGARFVGALVVTIALCGCATGGATKPGVDVTPPVPALDASLWIQTSAEAYLLRVSEFAAATAAVERGLADPTWSALGQGDEAAALPAAVILDVDETTLDNMAYNARLVREGESYDRENWREWVDARAAKAVPGALEFCHRARELGVAVFYVTNRDAPQEAATRANLGALGFPLDAPGDAVRLRGERPEWGSDKTTRFAEIGRSFRVLVLVGDDLNDFLSGARGATLAERRELAARHAERFGRDWFLLPNPVHGSWLRSAVGDDPSDEALPEVERRLRRLDAFEPGGAPEPVSAPPG